MCRQTHVSVRDFSRPETTRPTTSHHSHTNTRRAQSALQEAAGIPLHALCGISPTCRSAHAKPWAATPPAQWIGRASIDPSGVLTSQPEYKYPARAAEIPQRYAAQTQNYAQLRNQSSRTSNGSRTPHPPPHPHAHHARRPRQPGTQLATHIAQRPTSHSLEVLSPSTSPLTPLTPPASTGPPKPSPTPSP